MLVRTPSRRLLCIAIVAVAAACQRSQDDLVGPAQLAAPAANRPSMAAAAAAYLSPGRFSITYYGNWCGGGWSGGVSGGAFGSAAPVDKMDVACQKHDYAYQAADQYWGPKYKAAKTTSDRKSYCTSWRDAYASANKALAVAASLLPGRVALAWSMTIGETPDVWGYDSRIYGPHPWKAYQRNDYAERVITAKVLGLFNDPPCSTMTGLPG